MTLSDASPGRGNPLATLDRAVAVIEDLFNVLAAITIFLVMIGTVVGIVARLAGAPIFGALPGGLRLAELGWDTSWLVMAWPHPTPRPDMPADVPA